MNVYFIMYYLLVTTYHGISMRGSYEHINFLVMTRTFCAYDIISSDHKIIIFYKKMTWHEPEVSVYFHLKAKKPNDFLWRAFFNISSKIHYSICLFGSSHYSD